GRDENRADDRGAGAGRLTGLPGDQWIDEAGILGGAFHDRPAVVLSGLDQIDLIPGVLTELGGVQALVGVPGEALNVAVAEAVDECAERVARRGFAVRRHAQDLAAETVQ